MDRAGSRGRKGETETENLGREVRGETGETAMKNLQLKQQEDGQRNKKG